MDHDYSKLSPLDPAVLHQLMDAENVLPTLPTTEKTGEFATEVIVKIPGVSSCRFYMPENHDPSLQPLGLNDKSCPVSSECPPGNIPNKCQNSENRDRLAIDLKTPSSCFGTLFVTLNNQDLFAAYYQFIKNFCNHIAVHLENRNQRKKLLAQNEELKKRHDTLKNLVHQRNRELSESEEKFSTAFQSAPLLMTITSLETGQFLDVNDAFVEVTGYSRDVALGSTSVEIGWAEQAERERMLEVFKAEGRVKNMEVTTTCADGSKLYCLYSGEIIEFGGKKRLLSTATDITEKKEAEQALRKSEDLLAEVTRKIPVVLYQFYAKKDGTMGLRYISERSEAIVGLKAEPDGFLERFVELVVPEHREKFLQSIEYAVRNVSPWQYRGQLQKTDGEVIWFDTQSFPSVREDEVVFHGFFRDISASQKAKEQLREKDAMLAKIASQVPGMIYQFMMKPGGRFSVPYTSNGVIEIFGCSPDDIKDEFEPVYNAIHPDDRAFVVESIHESARNLSQFKCEYRVQLPGKPVAWMLGSSTPEKMDDGTIIWSGYNVDITERKHAFEEIKKANKALLESEARFKALHNASFGGIVIHDKGLILECNKGLSKMTGFSYEELIGMDGLTLISDDTRDTVIRNIESDYEKPYEAKGVRKDGEEYPLRLEARKIPYKGKDVRVVEFRDITENKRAEEEKEELKKQLNQAQKLESIGRLAGGVAHDFNNMLSVVVGHVEMGIQVVEENSELYESLVEIRKAAKRSADLTRQLLAFARKQTISPKVIDLNNNIEGILKMLKRLIGEGIELKWIPNSNLWPIRVDPSQIDQILTNLCVNARDALKNIGEITITTGSVVLSEEYCLNHPGSAPGDYVLLSVSDNGCGMDNDTLANIFEPFFTTKEPGQGTGLGLATVYGVVKQNGGFLDVKSDQDKGTTFKVHFPRCRTKGEYSEKKTKKSSLIKGQETILLVEDEAAILNMITAILEKFGYRVLATDTPGDAIQRAREFDGEIHLLITDVIMPEMNGRDLAKNILSLYPNVQRLFMSGYTADIIAHHGVLDEGVNFINKPFTPSLLGEKIRQVLDRDER